MIRKKEKNNIMKKQTKICTKCKEEKLITEFYVQKGGRFGVRSQCKPCNSKNAMEWQLKHPEKVKESIKKYYLNNKKKVKESRIKYGNSKKGKLNKKQSDKRYREKNKNNPEYKRKHKKSNKKWKENNPGYSNNYIRQRRKTDNKFKIKLILRNILNRVLNLTSQEKTTRTVKMLGYNSELLKNYLEKLFKPEMSWDNYGTYWEIDHIISIDWFIKNNITNPKIINNLINLQPLTCKENRSKGNVMDKKLLPMYDIYRIFVL